MDLGSRVLPTLTKLSATTGETASVAVLYEESALVIQRVAADRALRVEIKPGTKMPLHNSASGRILTAYAPVAELKRAESAGATLPTTCTRRADRARGYASQIDDYIFGMASLAVPVLTDAHEMGTIALAVAAPSARYQISPLLDAIRIAASELGSLLS
jgi:DNA-binding IclR family transcriptional regulator